MELAKNKFTHSIAVGEKQIGLWVTLASSFVAEVTAHSGYDWAVIDMEHSPKWSAAFNLKIPISKIWSINSSSNYVGIMELPKVFEMNDNGKINSVSRPTESKPFSIHNINVNGIFNSGNEIYFGLLNIFNFRQKESPLVAYNDPNYSKGFSPNFDTSYAYAPNHGRELFIGYRLKLGKR